MSVVFRPTPMQDSGEPATASGFRWPDDYSPRDGGRMLVRMDYIDVFDRLGWQTVDDVLGHSEVTLLRRLPVRENCRLTLPSPGGHGTTVAYLKRHFGSEFHSWLWNTVTGREWRPPGIAEAEALGQCQRAGVPSLSVIAAGRTTRRWPWQARSFFLSEEIRGAVPADDFWLSRFGSNHADGSDSPSRRRVLEAIATTAARLHRAGLYHRDFYWCHFFVRQSRPDHFVAHLIDLQRIGPSRWFSWRWRIKDLAQFLFSVPTGRVTDNELAHWFRTYAGTQSPGLGQRLLFAVSRLRARFYQWKDG